MKNLNSKLLSYLKNVKNINPNRYQVSLASKIEGIIKNKSKIKILKLSKDSKNGVYIYGSVGVGKSVLIKGLNEVYPESKMLHFSDLIFNLQAKNKKNDEYIEKIKKKKLILIDEFFINNITNLILFRKFLKEIKTLGIPIVMSGNKEINDIYDDPINPKLCEEIRGSFHDFFITIQIKSRVDYRSEDSINNDFFLIKKRNKTSKQNIIIKDFSIQPLPKQVEFKRRGNKFKIKKVYGNLIDINFEDFFKKNLIFQDFEILAKKIRIFVIRNITQMDESSKNILARFISFIDVLYENKNILSISTNVELDKLYNGKTNSFEFKRTISRLKEMGSNNYINKNLMKLRRKSQ